MYVRLQEDVDETAYKLAMIALIEVSSQRNNSDLD